MSDAYLELIRIFKALRDPQTGCPWDVEQTHQSLIRYALEEAYEVVDAIEHGSMDDLRDELGDMLLQVALHSQIASESGQFDLNDVVNGLNAKMVRRHPHVFGDVSYDSIDEQKKAWDEIKKQERGGTDTHSVAEASALDGVSLSQPALQRAHQLQKKAASVGFDWTDLPPVFDKLEEEIAEVKDALDTGEAHERVAEEIGDLLFAAVNLARHLGVNAEEALRRGSNKFVDRFYQVENKARVAGHELPECSLEEMEVWWQQAKDQDKSV